LCRYAPIGAISQELVKFDTQLLQHPDISGLEYQQGQLAGYEMREYLLEQWRRTCAYCGATGVPLQVEHIVPKVRGGSDRVTNLTVACKSCNSAKGTQTAVEFGHPEVQAQARLPLNDAAAINATRWALYRRLLAMGLRVEVGTGGRTKWNRTQRGLPKAHWIDAACVGASTPATLHTAAVMSLTITASGHGTRQLCGTNRYGFPTRHRTRRKCFFGFHTGDVVCAQVPAGHKTTGFHVGRVLVRASGSFDLVTRAGRVQGISYRYCRMLSRSDGYLYIS
jgi:5-methylcytosine-specific restriction endonuclease McrA